MIEKDDITTWRWIYIYEDEKWMKKQVRLMHNIKNEERRIKMKYKEHEEIIWREEEYIIESLL